MNEEYERQLSEAAIRYLALFEEGLFPNLDEFIAAEYPQLQSELKPYIEALLDEEMPPDPVLLAAEDDALWQSEQPHAQAQFEQLMRLAFAPTLDEARQARRLTLGKLARSLDLPMEVLDRIERGSVLLGSLPSRLFQRLAEVLQQTEAEVQAMLEASQRHAAPHASYLSAADGTRLDAEPSIPFQEAMAASSASPEQRRLWSEPAP